MKKQKKVKIKKHTECVKVVVRCRPMMSHEKEQNREYIVAVNEKTGEIAVRDPKQHESVKPKTYTFDYVFGHS